MRLGMSSSLDMNVLDLAPSLGHRFAGFSLDEDRQSQESVSDKAARNGQYGVNPQHTVDYHTLVNSDRCRHSWIYSSYES